MENSVGETGDREKRVSNVLKELQRQSSLVYRQFLESPVVGGLSGWDKVRPSPVYDFNPPPCKPTPSKKSNSRFPRSLRHKAVATPPTTCYMSGEYDENYSYVYTPGLSKRCRREIAQNSEKTTRFPLPHPPVYPLVPHSPMPHAPVVYPQSRPHATHSPAPKGTVSTVYLDPDISQPPLLKQKEAQLQSELAKVVKMQMKPELLVEQIIIENRLRALGGMTTHCNSSLNLGVGVNSKMLPNHHLDKTLNKTAEQQSRSAPSLLPPTIFHPHYTQKPPSKSKPKRKAKPLLDWCSLHSSEAATSPSNSLQRTSGAIIASARKEVSNLNNMISVKGSSAQGSKAAVGSMRKSPNLTIGNGFVSHTAGVRLPSLTAQPLGARNHSGGSRLPPVGHPNLQIT